MQARAWIVAVAAALTLAEPAVAEPPVVFHETALLGRASSPAELGPVSGRTGEGLHNTTINLNAGSGISGNADALAAFQRAARNWTHLLADEIVLNVDIDLADLDPGILGSTSSTSYYADFDFIRDLVAAGADTGSPAETATLSYLPTAAQFSANEPNGFTSGSYMQATRANLLALGVDPGAMGGSSQRDGAIAFSSNYAWDFDNSDGVTAGTFDFETVATHEIGHVLGFVSEVNYADYVLEQGATADLFARPLDLFRFATGDVPTTTSEFTFNPRDLVPGGTDYFYTGEGTIPMSTGRFNGDGRQASHWKDNLGLGLMDPTLTYQEIVPISENDLVAMDLIGWEIVPEPATLGMLLLGSIALVARRRRPA